MFPGILLLSIWMLWFLVKGWSFLFAGWSGTWEGTWLGLVNRSFREVYEWISENKNRAWRYLHPISMPTKQQHQQRGFNNPVEEITHYRHQSASLDLAPTAETSSGYHSKAESYLWSEQHGLPFSQLLDTQPENNRWTLSPNVVQDSPGKPDIFRQVDYFLSHLLH